MSTPPSGPRRHRSRRDSKVRSHLDGSEAESVDFSVLAGFDVHSVSVRSEALDLYVPVRSGRSPLDYPLGDCCGDRGCRYPCVELIGFARKDDLVEAVIRDRMRRWPDLPADALLDGLLTDVYRVRSHERIRIASLRHHPFMYRVPVSLERLRETGHRDTAHGAPEWEVIRTIKDVHAPAAVDLPFRRWTSGRDLAVYRDHVHLLELRREGSFGDFVPLADERGQAFWLKLFQRILGGPNA